MVTSNFVPATNNNAPRNDVLFHSPATKLFVNKQDLGTGSLHVTESNVIWRNRATTPTNIVRRISLMHHTISLYGVQKQPTPSLFMVINYELRSFIPELVQETESDDEDSDSEDPPITELRFIPEQESDLPNLHTALNKGQILHPDPNDEIYDDDDVDIFEEIPDPFDVINPDTDNRIGQLYLDDDELVIEGYYEDDDADDRGR